MGVYKNVYQGVWKVRGKGRRLLPTIVKANVSHISNKHVTQDAWRANLPTKLFGMSTL